MEDNLLICFEPLAQLVRAVDLKSECHRFKPYKARHKEEIHYNRLRHCAGFITLLLMIIEIVNV